MSTFYVYKDSISEFRWRLRANNGEIILHSSEGYTSKQNCLNSIASVKANAPYDSRYHKFASTKGSHFSLQAANGETLGMSEPYSTTYSRDVGIETCKREAPGADVSDIT